MTEQEILKEFNAPKGAILEKQFKNGNIKIKRRVVCDRCGNKEGIYYIGVLNGKLLPSHVDQGVCFKCLGSGYAWESEILMTPENKAKHDAEIEKKRQKWAEKQAKIEAQREAEEAEKERIRLAEEARIAEEKARSAYRGVVGEKIDEVVKYIKTAHFEVKSFSGFGTNTMYIHTFEDKAGNKLIWKTSTDNFRFKINLENPNESEEVVKVGDMVHIKGTIKEHSEYKGYKQTLLARCKVTLLEGESK